MKKSILFAFIIFSFISQNIFAQKQDVYKLLEQTLSYRGLSREDITIPVDTTDTINTNQCKLILPIVYNIMRDPLSSMPFLDTVMNYKNLELRELVYTMFKDINYYKGSIADNYRFSTDLNVLVKMLADRIKKSYENENILLQSFSKEELEFLENNLFSLFLSSDQNAPENFDIYKLDAAEDSSNVISKRILDILSKVDRKQIYENSLSDFIYCYQLYEFILENRNSLQNTMTAHVSDPNITGDIEYYYNEDNMKIVIGGTGKNTYSGKFEMIIDLDGDDAYYVDRDTTFTKNFNCIIDVSGNDYYTTNSKFALGASVFSSGFIFDKEGDDTYKGTSVDLGAAICGIGLIYDENGSDIYSGNSFSIGAGCFGVGMVVDRTGNDFYIANTYSQGFGNTEGIGIIVDNIGNDTYTVNPLTPDIGRSNDHFLSMCQGFGFGLRPYYAGGIGVICDGEGNDNYSADIFGQGCSYWYSLGIVVDSSGNDRYNCFHYAQGSGIHFSVGLMKDYEGWDYYSTNWVSQGCGHDYGFGFLWDVKGNDNYSCYGLSQGSGSANGIGLQIDESGRDGYLSKDNNTQGFGLPSRDYGSIGILLDASGTDFYSKGGYDSLFSNNSRWGVLNDYFIDDLHPQIAEDEFKIEIDTTKTYSRDELYLFARTLEPRFSKWAIYGFNKMVEDSVNTVEYLFTKIGSPDIRDAVVIRNFIPRIGHTFSNFLIGKIKQYLNHEIDMNVDELAFGIFIIGESKNQSGKDLLYDLMSNDNRRIRSAAVNALGKMNISDSEFISKVSEKLIQLVSANDTKKTYNKDIAFAFRCFKDVKNIPALINLMAYNYYGVRFIAAEDLLEYGDTYFNYLTDNILSLISSNKIWFQAFLNSLTGLSKEKFKSVNGKVNKLDMVKDEVIKYNLIELLKAKKEKSNDDNFVQWVNEHIKMLEKNNKMKIRD